MSSVPEPNPENISTESSQGGNVIPPVETPTTEPRVFKNPTTIEEMNAMRAQLYKDKTLKRRVKLEYKKKVQIEAQGMEYSPPDDLKQFKILQPRSLANEDNQTDSVISSTRTVNDTSTKDISDQVFVGEKQVE